MKSCLSTCRFTTRSQIQIFNPKNIILERSRGAIGLLTLKSGKPTSLSFQEAADFPTDIESLQNIQKSVSNVEDVQIRQYDGRIKGGNYAGERVLIKMYPRTNDCDILATNELKMHEELQPPKTKEECDNLRFLIGGYETTNTQCLVFRRRGNSTLAEYSRLASTALEKGSAVGVGDLWDILDPVRSIKRRKKVFVQIFREIASGLHFMHCNLKLHQSLGPESIHLSDINEGDCLDMIVEIGDLALGVDMSDKGLGAQKTLGDVWDYANNQEMLKNSPLVSTDLWTRARNSGAWTENDKRNFGVADDVSSLGFLFLYSILSSFSPQGSIDGPSLYRLLQSTFDCDVEQFREYCKEDDNLSLAVEFMDMEDGAGWELIGAMINNDWKSRPTSDSCLNHRFLDGSLFLNEM